MHNSDRNEVIHGTDRRPIIGPIIEKKDIGAECIEDGDGGALDEAVENGEAE